MIKTPNKDKTPKKDKTANDIKEEQINTDNPNQINDNAQYNSFLSSLNIDNLNIELEQKKANDLTNNNEEKNPNKSSIMKSINSMSSIDSAEYLSARSSSSHHSIEKVVRPIETELNNFNINETDSLYSESQKSKEEIEEEDKEIKELYQQMKDLIAKGEYDQIKEIEMKIIEQETEARKALHEGRINKLTKYEKEFKNSRGDYIIEEEIDNNEKFVLANIVMDEGYAIVPLSEIERDYERKEFCDYVFYIKK